MSQEEWRAIPDLPDYEASSLGRIRRLRKTVERKDGHFQSIPGRVKAQTLNNRGYLIIKVGTERKHVHVHRAVLKAFSGMPKENNFACHFNDNRLDNRPENLYWGNASTNQFDAVRNNRHKSVKKTHCKNGHLLTPENCRPWGLKQNPPRRMCKQCHSANRRRRKQNVSTQQSM